MILKKPQRLWQRFLVTRFSFQKLVRFWILLITIIIILLIIPYIKYGLKSLAMRHYRRPRKILSSDVQCGDSKPSIINDHHYATNKTSSRAQVENTVLVLTETPFSQLGRLIEIVLLSNRIDCRLQTIRSSLPILTNLSKGKYSLVIFENIEHYLGMDQWNRELLDKYLLKYEVGLVGFFPAVNTKHFSKLRGFPLFIEKTSTVTGMFINGENPILRITRNGGRLSTVLKEQVSCFFSPNHSTYIPIGFGFNTNDTDGTPKILTILDTGKFDGIKRIFFGSGLSFWLHKLILLDAVSYLTRGQMSRSLTRYISIDIDDVFVGPKGFKMIPEDVLALVDAQKRFKELIPGFKFNLGFSGKFFKRGFPEEQDGDEFLIKYSKHFLWFGHVWDHREPHTVASTENLIDLMKKNRDFAESHNISVDSGYSISPHHSGVYPVHDQLFDSWKTVWNVQVTSTEEYPHLKPPHLRRGFIHRGIRVLPRQTCGLYTHTHFFDKFPGGSDRLNRSIFGGDLFQTIVFNPISIFMTHQNNYANDRLSYYTFESVFKFLKCWTNLRLAWTNPLDLGSKYFRLFPEEVDPLWGNPCLSESKRHLKIWSKSKNCSQFPNFLVVGPQKTGTTALFSFLSMHPSLTASLPSAETFEEIQFFNGKNYFKGIDWYMKFFQSISNTSSMFFEKSANYFEGTLVPKRVKALLPKAMIVITLIRPEKRAYSWYQHAIAHDDNTALAHTFKQVITSNSKASRSLRELRNKCLNPGLYSKHLEKWLDFFPSSQIVIIDGEKLKSDPIIVMSELQKSLQITPLIDYGNLLRFDSRKGFFCQILNGKKNKCLGRGKGRIYPSITQSDEKILKEFYRKPNNALEKLLTRMNWPVPSWLVEDLQEI